MRCPLLLIFVLVTSSLANAQENRLVDSRPKIDQSRTWVSRGQVLQKISVAPAWTGFGGAEVSTLQGLPTFTLKDTGHISQDVFVDRTEIGKFALFVSLGSSDRVFGDSNITDHPYLYGYMMDTPDHIITYLQGQEMLWQSAVKDEWKCLYGAFQIPEGTIKIRFFLAQALSRGTEPMGSARFRRLGLFFFDTETAAKDFVGKYCSNVD